MYILPNEKKSQQCARIAVVIPSYKVASSILSVIENVPSFVWRIYVIDDCCPEKTGKVVTTLCSDPRVKVFFQQDNQGVGGATLYGFNQAALDGCDIFIKVDGDGQMDLNDLQKFINPILLNKSDYCKGNRFYNINDLAQMPRTRLFGNAILSFITKISTGYWNCFDPTNGFIAIHRTVFQKLPIEKIAKRYFFETDLLFRLNTINAVVLDISIAAKYGAEISNLKIKNELFVFLFGNIRIFFKRIFYSYFLRGFNVGTIELICGFLLFSWGLCFGLYEWNYHAVNNIVATSGTVMLSALPFFIGFQLLLSFLNYDISSLPKKVIHSQ